MEKNEIKKNVFVLGVKDWNRRLFDSLIPLPDGTSYNAYLVKGREKTALLDTVDPAKADILMEQLKNVSGLDYVVSHHAEQDHSGSIPFVLKKYPEAKVVASGKGKELLMAHLDIKEDRFLVLNDGDSLPLGDKTLKMVYTPWVHWPETVSTYLEEDKILFSCDFFGSHLAASSTFVKDKAFVTEAAKRYYAEIMMPFRKQIGKNLEKLESYDIDLIAPSHGPVYNDPEFILDAYKDWISDKVKNLVVIPYISMHGSTEIMVNHLVDFLIKQDIDVIPFDLAVTDLGKLAISLVDAATIILGTPTVHTEPHPVIHYAAHLANALRPKVKYLSVIGSWGWSSRAVEKLAGMIPNLNVEVLEPVLCKGLPREDTYMALKRLAGNIKEKHRVLE